MARLAAVLLLALFVAVAAGAQEFDPRRSFDYRFDSADAQIAEVQVSDEGFEWPGLEPGVDTVMLGLEILAKGGQPRLDARAAGLEVRQYFEAKARGVRYFNLSSLVGAVDPGEWVVLAGERLSWSLGAAQLFGFANRPLEGARVLVLAPHPDDAEIAAFGLYRGTVADVVTVTAGDAGGENFRALYDEDGEHYRVKGRIRAWDSITVPFFGGVPPGKARNLGYYDATLRDLWLSRPEPVPPPLAELESPNAFRAVNVPGALLDRSFESSWPSLVRDLKAELELVKPEVVAAPHPFLDAHRDHQFTTIALLEALETYGGSRDVPESRPELYLYTNHPVEAEHHPFGPRDGAMSLPPWYGDDLEYDRVYSHPLDDEAVRWKLIALEAMHDLRRFDLREPLSKSERKQARKRLRPARIDYSYYRRGARPNELFFVLSVERAEELRRRFLERVEQEVAAQEAADRED